MDLFHKNVYGKNENVEILDPYDVGIVSQMAMAGFSDTITGTKLDHNNCGNDFDWTITTATNIDVVSNSAQDGVAGTGIQQILVAGLDEDWNILNEFVILNGTTSVQTTNKFLRVNLALGQQFGSTGESVGTITGSANGINWFLIEPAEGNAYLGRWSIPKDHRLVIKYYNVTSDKGNDYLGWIYTKTPFNNRAFPANKFNIHEAATTVIGHPTMLPEKTDIFFKTQKVSGSSGVAVTLSISGFQYNMVKYQKFITNIV
jgi:hypothetical protein